MDIIHDIPLTGIGKDLLGREPLVDPIVDSINNLVSADSHPCVVYGIYGKWGEGKTSLMNFIKESLLKQGKKDGINIVEFNPWIANSEDALLREFFKTIMSDPAASIRRAFQKYGSLAVFASKTVVNAFVPGVGTALGEFLGLAKDVVGKSEASLAALKKKASTAIKDNHRHLVVMIDDVDRLDKDEVHSVFRLIRQVADFDNCIYIIAMDPDMVSKSLADFYGKGSEQDGRRFLDKIVQVPVVLPKIQNADMERIFRGEIGKLLLGVSQADIEIILNKITPLFRTCRDVKRYCNQLKFVLPHLQNEVNLVDLCLLEAIKIVSLESYNRIYESRSALLHEAIGSIDYLLDEEKKRKKIDDRYREAKDYVLEGFEGSRKEAMNQILDALFDNRSFLYRDDVDEKKISADIYFAKYFILSVPSDLIPDTTLDEFKPKLLTLDISAVTSEFDAWVRRYSASEVKRATLYLIRKFEGDEERAKVASIVAQALSVCLLAKEVPYHIYDPTNVCSFIPIQIIVPYLYVRDKVYAGRNVIDVNLLDLTLRYIFEKAEMNFCLIMLCYCDDIFVKGIYDGKNVLPGLFERFKALDFDEQFRYRKYLLVTFFKYWKDTDSVSFNKYSSDLFGNEDIPYLTVFDKLIDGTDDDTDVACFVELFSVQTPLINERLHNDQLNTPEEHHSVKTYKANYTRTPNSK